MRPRVFGIEKKKLHGCEYLEAYEGDVCCEITVIEKSAYDKAIATLKYAIGPTRDVKDSVIKDTLQDLHEL